MLPTQRDTSALHLVTDLLPDRRLGDMQGKGPVPSLRGFILGFRSVAPAAR